MSIMTQEERIEIEDECVAVACLHPELRPRAEEILKDLINDNTADREIYEERVIQMYNSGHVKCYGRGG